MPAQGIAISDNLEAVGIGHVDLAFDARGAGTVPTLVEPTGSPDRVVTIADFATAEYGVRLTQGVLAGEADGSHGLAVAVDLATRGRFRVPLHGTFRYLLAAAAHFLAEQRPRWDKVALVNESL